MGGVRKHLDLWRCLRSEMFAKVSSRRDKSSAQHHRHQQKHRQRHRHHRHRHQQKYCQRHDQAFKSIRGVYLSMLFVQGGGGGLDDWRAGITHSSVLVAAMTMTAFNEAVFVVFGDI